jgi:hypothetical protein
MQHQSFFTGGRCSTRTAHARTTVNGYPEPGGNLVAMIGPLNVISRLLL